ncbi:MAG: ParB/RepB/Spo0J family partition protein [Bacteroidetes bacterium]|nr:MAG: ParB/RepB/Spo0J family partition protein [Bacteroidota bacterium]
MNAKKRALGKGLSALLDTSGAEAQPSYDIEKDLHATGTIAHVLLDLIDSNPYQPRTDFDEESLQELAASIKEQGVIQPVTIRKTKDGKFQLISGERRCRAAVLAGLTEIPAYIRAADDQNMREMAIVENIQRENLNPIEIALGYQQLIDDFKLTQEMLAERLGKSRPSIANHLRLLKLPAEIQIGLRQDLISMGHARALVSIDHIQTQIDVFNDVVAQGLSVRDVEEIVKNLAEYNQEGQENPNRPKNKTDHSKYYNLQKSLSEVYGTKVQVKARMGGKGSVVINFSSEEDLERILKILQK